MNYQNLCSCQSGEARSSDACCNTWQTPRTGCGCGSNTWRTPRTGCGCGNNTWRNPKTGCGCGNNTWRNPRTSCGCDNNTWRTPRTTCGCENTVRNNDNCEKNNCSTLNTRNNAGTVWKNRNGCCANTVISYTPTRTSGCGCAAAVARTSHCNGDTPCAEGASADCPLSGRSLAMVYSPHQEFQSLYDPREGLSHGTVFCELNKPFYGTGRNC